MDMASVLNCAAEVSTILAFLVMLPGACAASRKRAGEHRRRAYRPRRARPGACAVPADITRRHRGPDRDLRPGPGPACIRRTWPILLRNARAISGGAGWPAAARARASRFQLFRSRWQRRIGIHRPGFRPSSLTNLGLAAQILITLGPLRLPPDGEPRVDVHVTPPAAFSAAQSDRHGQWPGISARARRARGPARTVAVT